MARRPVVLLVVLLAACGPSSVPEFRLSGETMVLRGQEELALCDLVPGAGPTPRYPAAPTCLGLGFLPQPGTWGYVEGDFYLALAADSDAPRCQGGCNQLRRVSVATSTAQDLLPEPRPLRRWAANAERALWSDLERDENGGCFFPDGDTDCVLDLWTADRAGVAAALTTHGGLLPGGTSLSAQSFDLSSAGVVYILRGSDPACAATEDREVGAGCVTSVRFVDPTTGEDREVVDDTQLNLNVRLAEDHLVWTAGPSVADLQLVTRPLGGGATRTIASRVDARGAAFAVTYPWVVWSTDGQLFVYDVDRDERRAVTGSDDMVLDFDVSEGRILRLDEDRVFTLVDLETLAARFVMELP